MNMENKSQKIIRAKVKLFSFGIAVLVVVIGISLLFEELFKSILGRNFSHILGGIVWIIILIAFYTNKNIQRFMKRIGKPIEESKARKEKQKWDEIIKEDNERFQKSVESFLKNESSNEAEK
jgi:hypothetical protein